MPKVLFQASYTQEGMKEVLKVGGSFRVEATEKAIESVGGTLEAYYYAFGDTDVFIIADLPDTASVTALSLIFNAAGRAKVKTTVLITPEEVDQATKKRLDYLPPGQ